MQYKHYSFDLWGTLIKSNLQFKSERTKFFTAHFNINHLPENEVADIIRDVDKMCDFTNEVVGENIDALEMISMVLHRLKFPLVNLRHRDIQSIYHTLESLFDLCTPELYNWQTVYKLKDLKSKGATLSILSNTAFIKGASLRKFIDNGALKGIFDFQLYSDEIGYSKPNKKVFQQMIDSVSQIRNFDPASMDQIIHVGDNPVADVLGAEEAGITGFLINNDLYENSKGVTIIHVP